MGQAEIQKILNRNRGKWISTIEIRSKLNQNSSVVTRALNKMFQYGEVKKKQLPIKKKHAQYYVCFWCIK